jgi:hypothetical protein
MRSILDIVREEIPAGFLAEWKNSLPTYILWLQHQC